MKNYIVKYLRDNAKDEKSRLCIDFLKIEFDREIYNFHYNAHNAAPELSSIDKVKAKATTFKEYVESAKRRGEDFSSKLNVLSFIEFPIHEHLSDGGINAMSPVWNPVKGTTQIGDWKTIKWFRSVRKVVGSGNLQAYLDPGFHNNFLSIIDHLIAQFKSFNIRALFIRSDIYYLSRFAIHIFNKMELPTFIFTHGLPAIYSLELDNRSNYLMVWGEKMKQNYLNVGFDPSKIKVVGHPSYPKLPETQKLRSDLSNVLVIPVSASLGHQNKYDEIVLMDKSSTVLYLYQVQSILVRSGVMQARFRVHPSINRNWIFSLLDQSFYRIDTQSLDDSLNSSSLIIGATSSVFLEALINGVNYLVYEPVQENGLNMLNTKLVPPFDGSDEKVRIAFDEETLFGLISENSLTDYSIVHDYIEPFNGKLVYELVNG